MDLKNKITQIALNAKAAQPLLAVLDTKKKNAILLSMAKSLKDDAAAIIKANDADMKAAEKKGKSKAMLDRLKLDRKRIDGMAQCLAEVANLNDPIGQMESMSKRPNGLLIGKMRVPIGVIGIVYESRPNVTSDCIGLCVKSGNCIILRGGSESINSNTAVFNALRRAGIKAGLPENAINLITDTDRDAVKYLVSMTGLVDLVIPRGGESLIKEVMEHAKVPVIKHYKGVCHVFVDESADMSMAERIAMNAKVQRPSVCNAMETLLVHAGIASDFIPKIFGTLKAADVELRGCERTLSIAKGTKKATEEDWYEEYNDLILSVRIVSSLDDAISHIRKYGTMHSDSIVTENYANAMKFVREVDSACVYVNASTRFTDGHEFGKGAEIGISTDKLHARGPMGLEELTTYKYVIFGNGQTRE